MQLAKAHGEVTTIGVQHQSSFSIAMNGKAFRVLSDTLYQNKIGSFLRETCCNALDAHVMAGKAHEPFEVHLPDAFEPWVSVKDNGIGMSHDEVEQVYTQYFNSTKDQSNEMIGAMGLGSKSGFSLTDAFTVIVRRAGMKRIYSMFINSESLPTVALMSEDETDECNGVEVQLAVKNNDITRFHNELRDQLRFFKVKPIVVNIHNFRWHDEQNPNDIVIQTEDLDVYKGGYHDYVIQGQVGYPIDAAQLGEGIDYENYKFFSNISNSRTVHLKFNIGEIEVTASREGVQYSTFTLKNINDKLAKCREDFTKQVVDKLDAFPTEWEKVVYLNSDVLVREIAVESNLNLKHAKANSVQGKVSSYYFDIEHLLSEIVKVTGKDAAGNPVTHDERHWLGFCAVYKGDFQRVSEKDAKGSNRVYPNSQKQVIVIRDTGKHPVVKLRHFFNTNDYDWCLSITPANKVKDIGKYVKDLTEALGGFAEVYRISEMVEPPKGTAAARPSYVKPTAYQYDCGDVNGCYKWDRLYDKPEDMIDGGLYVEIDRFTINSNYNVLGTYKKFKDKFDKELIGLRAVDIAKIKDNPEWIKLEDAVESFIDEIKKDKFIQRAVNVKRIKDRLGYISFSNTWLKIIKENPDLFPKTHPFNRAIRAQNIINRLYNKNCARIQYANSLNIESSDDCETIAESIINDRVEAINMYPLLTKSFDSYYSHMFDNYDHMMLYIRAVHAANS